jgi:hypothetical protein
VKRQLFNLAAAVLLLLCAATVFLWARSYRYGDFLSIFRSSTEYRFASVRGQICFQADATNHPDGARNWSVRSPLYPIDSPATIAYSYTRLGFTWTECAYAHRWPARFVIVAIPFWFLVALQLALPIRWAYQHRWRSPAGHCPNCGYDLRATPERCPECGMVAKPQLAGGAVE